MAKRPYAQRGIVELEDLFAASTNDRAILAALASELGHRKTTRAIQLRTKTERQLKLISASAPSRTPAQPSPQAEPNSHRPKPAPSPTPVTMGAPLPANPMPQPESEPEPEPAFIFEPPATANEPAAILAAWTALEALSPQTYRRPEDRAGGDRRCVADLARTPLAWIEGERSRPSRILFYEIYLGAVRMDAANSRLGEVFGLDEEISTRSGQKAALGTLLVDRSGRLLEDKCAAVSSFGWAIPRALRGDLGGLGHWSRIQPTLIAELEKRVRRFDDDGKPLPITKQLIDDAHAWLLNKFGLPAELVEPPSFAIRIYHYFKAKRPPEPSLLNSFFLGDLARAQLMQASGDAPKALRQYLAIDVPTETHDLLHDQAAVERAVAPSLTPTGRWPAPGGHPLVLLQQAAVNIVRNELEADGLIAVNGPPGTGKTTLLRDIVAGAVIDRARAMAKMADPDSAFTASGEKVAAGPKAFNHLYRLDRRLRGHELVVASSNNKAVENVSRELPSVNAIGRDTAEMTYFQSVSDLMHGGPANDDDGDGSIEAIETWGLIAAVLGNANNRFHFTQRFWWDDELGFRLYLKAAKGDSVVIEIKDADGKIIERRSPKIVQLEKPPSPSIAAANWSRARKRFNQLHAEIQAELDALEKVRAAFQTLAGIRADMVVGEARLPKLSEAVAHAQAGVRELLGPLAKARTAKEIAEGAITSHRFSRPGLLARLFNTRSFKAWTNRNLQYIFDQLEAEKRHGAAAQAYDKAASAYDVAEAALTNEQRHLDGLLEQERVISRAIKTVSEGLGDRIVDDSFFAQGHEKSNLTAPWVPDALHRKREDLFIAALDVHRAFIDVAARKISHNLSVLISTMMSGPPQNEGQRALLGDLWSTLFLVVPVVSTTFASIEAMFGELKTDDLGWLLIDEAGQALPQAAIGALMRARRTVVVGDPFQIPPVVSLPDRLTDEICRHFKVESERWAAPTASVQTVADRASSYRAIYGDPEDGRQVGLPLLVHRRCQEPMFGISNRIAYDGLMVHAVSDRAQGPIGQILGSSQWFDVDGEANGHWCSEEGEQVVAMLYKLAGAGLKAPDIFLITPFRLVAQELRQRLEREPDLFDVFGVDSYEWLRDRVGTIHTVQGREADSVILVLGAPAAAQARARGWAAGTPNILNVAVSRAKRNLYVVGSHGAWSGIGHAIELANLRSPSLQIGDVEAVN